MEKLLLNKIRTIEFLASGLNIHSERELKELDIADLVNSDKVTLKQIRDVLALKQVVDENKLFSFLTENIKSTNDSGDVYE